MSTAVPLKANSEPSWLFKYPDEPSVLEVPGGRWWTHASLTDIDGIAAYLTNRPLESLVCEVAGQSPLFLHPPTPTPFFALSRFHTLAHVIQPVYHPYLLPRVEWLYTCVGYLLPEIRVFLTILPTHSEFHVERREQPLTFV